VHLLDNPHIKSDRAEQLVNALTQFINNIGTNNARLRLAREFYIDNTGDTGMIKKCVCHNAYQDEKYGKGNRVHTTGVGNTKTGPKYTCTVCTRES
jgi:hypothetical protein